MPAASAKEVIKRAASCCEASTPVCTFRPEQIHHRRMRSQGGGDEPVNLLHVCGACHRFIHDNPAQSYERGWLLRRNPESRVDNLSES